MMMMRLLRLEMFDALCSDFSMGVHGVSVIFTQRNLSMFYIFRNWDRSIVVCSIPKMHEKYLFLCYCF